MMYRRKYWWPGVVILITGIAAVMTLQSCASASGSEEEAHSISSLELIRAFDEDERRADSLYTGRLLKVSGAVRELIPDEYSFLLRIGDPMLSRGVSCYLKDGQEEKYGALKKGDTVTVSGFCSGVLLDIVLEEGVIAKGQTGEADG